MGLGGRVKVGWGRGEVGLGVRGSGLHGLRQSGVGGEARLDLASSPTSHAL